MSSVWTWDYHLAGLPSDDRRELSCALLDGLRKAFEAGDDVAVADEMTDLFRKLNIQHAEGPGGLWPYALPASGADDDDGEGVLVATTMTGAGYCWRVVRRGEVFVLIDSLDERDAAVSITAELVASWRGGQALEFLTANLLDMFFPD